MNQRMSRRNFVAWVGALPGFGLLAYLIPVWWRYLFPTMQPWGFFSKQVLGTEKPQFVENTANMTTAWDMREFEFVRQARLFTAAGEYNTRVPGFLVAIPHDPTQHHPGEPLTPDQITYRAYSRICVHLGCVFTYQTTKAAVHDKFNYGNPIHEVHFACPCHLSVYDLSDLIPIPGVTIDPKDKDWMVGPRVVSGPAPRPARPFKVEVREHDQAHGDGAIYIIQLEGGGLS